MNYCLNSKELENILLFYLKGKPITNETLSSLFNNATQWQDKFLCTTFSLARIFERHPEWASLLKAMIPEFYSLPDKMFIETQECGEDFVDYLLRNDHSGEIDLETSLLAVAKKLSEHCYGKKTLRN